MKVTLEFEEADLKEMLTKYFYGNGFAVKNLPEVCMQFSIAFPDGLKVQAEIMQVEPGINEAVLPARSMHPPAQDTDSDVDEVNEELPAGAVLTLNDLMDPEPRKGRIVSAVNTKDDFAELLNKSKRLENERRRT